MDCYCKFIGALPQYTIYVALVHFRTEKNLEETDTWALEMRLDVSQVEVMSPLISTLTN